MSLEAKRALVIDFGFFNGMELMPELKSSRDKDSDENADEEEPAIGWQHDQKNGDYGASDEQTGGAFEAETEAGHGLILRPIPCQCWKAEKPTAVLQGSQ
jgi:hypothetical protein